ncbi:gamma-glutamyl-gamma-aminobutyrate hydrolase family protein [Lacticaseibacillus rhamnosus]|uniref:gamma-glutamyl-gamma-aminobutyrate hydrolase family protein n=1 Tax=Lacticaseibacillus rhamnosus TaxID=47715 RepID=UPI0006677D12|nr:gamma-glutamyl-gamma-aminobutyrate hydrolase family protein [Lacticaseibacillus rhamnosus]GMB72213.1 gamma-glutamyl-gamma-aminobutyrate hydrolase [Lacticaseibacillus rhamnosus]
MKPRIGIPTDELIEINPIMPNNHPAYAPHDVKEAFIKLGAIPLIIAFPDDVSKVDQLAQDYVQLIDGLMLPGGPDVDPTFYGEEPHPKIGMTLYQKDRFEIALIKAALAADKPIFGICRGIQIMNVAMGGTLYQDLESQYPELKIQHPQATLGQFATHHVELTAGSKLAKLYGQSTIKVNSRHHQAVKAVGKGLKVTAVAPDGVVEGMESTDTDLFLGVQWHPENMWQQEDPQQLVVFQDFLDRIAAHRK